jgi:hypothetical protein
MCIGALTRMHHEVQFLISVLLCLENDSGKKIFFAVYEEKTF